MESMRWSEAKRWEEETLGERSPPQPLLGLGEYESSSRSSVGWQSLNSVSPVWQRPILMGGEMRVPEVQWTYSLHFIRNIARRHKISHSQTWIAESFSTSNLVEYKHYME